MYWHCPKGHNLGHVLRGRLYLYDHATRESGEIARIVGIVTGSARVRCSICGAERKWFQKQTSVERALIVEGMGGFVGGGFMPAEEG